jgi:hypothetical protein
LISNILDDKVIVATKTNENLQMRTKKGEFVQYNSNTRI